MSASAAELVADGGAAAQSDDLFRSPAFLDAEGVTHTLRIESPGRVALVPLIVRAIEGSPRGRTRSRPTAIPGATISGEGERRRRPTVDWSATGLVSVFARERLAGEPWLAGRGGALARPGPRSRRCSGACGRGWSSRRAPTSAPDGRSSASPAPNRPAADRDAFAPPTSRPCAAPARPSATSSLARTSTRCSRSSLAGCWWPATTARSARRRSPRSATASCITTSAARPTSARDASPFKNVVARRCSTSPTSSSCGSTSAAGWRPATGWRLQARVRELRAALPHPRGRLRPRRLRRARRRPRGRRLLPRLPRGLSGLTLGPRPRPPRRSRRHRRAAT